MKFKKIASLKSVETLLSVILKCNLLLIFKTFENS